MADMTFAPPATNLTGAVEDLITNYRKAQALQKARDLELARKNALQGLMQGGDPQEGFRKLIGIGDLEGASAYAKAAKSMQPAIAKPMSAYQQYQVERGNKQDQLAEFQKRAAATPQSTKEYWNAYPPTAPQWYREGLGIGSGGNQGMPPETSQPEQPVPTPASAPAPAPAKWQPTQEQYKLIQSGKMATQEDAEKQAGLITDQLQRFKNNAVAIRDNPNLKFAVGSGVAEYIPEKMTQTLFPEVQDTRNQIDSLLSEARGNILNMFKEISGKAGTSGFGRVLLQEWQNFGNIIAPLHTSGSEPRFKQSLNQVIDYVDAANERIRKKYEETYGRPMPSGPGAQTTNVKMAEHPDTLLPGMQTISTPPPPGTTQAPASPLPSGMAYQDKVTIGRKLAAQGLNQQQIIDWFKARGVRVNPNE